ncbi:hypothetical protein EVAR_48951_1 [Eumeta japonica]|uniref:Uncharacterized protein n=1 Tax=Eumeta variegata TaxID=151549 RepID=A0A4C1Y6G7_EUMVA|nr:hypothetical protein EVAR_48951_1 [Eumeta japonica]
MCIAIKARIVCSKSFFPRSKNRVLFLHTYTVPGPQAVAAAGRSVPVRGCADGPGPRGALAAGAPVPVRGCADGPGPGATYTVPGPRAAAAAGAPVPVRGLRRGPGPLRGAAEAGAPVPVRGLRRGPGPLRRCAGGPPGAPVPVRGCADGPGPSGALPCRSGSGAAPTGRAPPVRVCRAAGGGGALALRRRPRPRPGDAGAPWTAPGAAGRVLRWSVSMRVKL